MKQGIVSLGPERHVDNALLDRITATICAIANNGPARSGRIILGVSDKSAHTQRIVDLDGIQPRHVGGRDVVGVDREARALGISLEDYHGVIRNHISNANLSEALKSSVLSSIDFNNYFGLGLIVITIPEQNEPSYFNELVYWRTGDSTEKAETAKAISDVVRRF